MSPPGIGDVQRHPQPHRAVTDRLVAEPVTVDAAAHDVGVPVVVVERGPVLPGVGVPTGDPVQLPGEDERAVEEELVLLVVTDDPQLCSRRAAPERVVQADPPARP
jgi:hypothetical protein